MCRAALLAVIVSLPLVAGCLAGPSQPDPGNAPADAGPSAAGNASHGAGVEVEEATGTEDGNASGSTTFRFDASNMTYEDELVRYAINVPDRARVAYETSAALGGYEEADTCATWSVRSDTRDTNGTGVSRRGAVIWAYRNGVYGEAVVAGQRHDVLGDAVASPSGGPPIRIRDEANWTVPSGGTIVVEIGGRSDAYPRAQHLTASATPSANRLQVGVTVEGAAEVVEMPRRSLRCGVGAYQAEGSDAGLYTQTTSATVGGVVPLTTENASTLLWHRSRSETPLQDGTVRVAEASWSNPFDVAESRPDGTEMALEFRRWVHLWPMASWTGPTWLMADAWWPHFAADGS